MVETVGNKLRRARNMRQLSIEDAARATKIRPRQIADLEADEYSNFANLAYARGFLVGYAKFLHVEVRSHLEVFEDANTFGLDDYQYLSEAPVGMYRAPTRPMRRKRRKHRLLAAVTTLAALAAVSTLWFFVVSYQRLGGNLGELAARQEARERATREGGPAINAGTQGVGAVDAKAPATVSPAEVIPVSVPVSSSPVPSSPAPTPERIVTTSAALAANENAAAVPVGSLALPSPGDAAAPAVPLPGDGTAARALTRGPDLRATLAGAPAGLTERDPAANPQAKVLANKPVIFDPAKRPNDPYQASAPQTVSNDALR